MDSAALAERISGWIKEKVEEAGAKGVVVGLSGGIDSAVVAALSRRSLGQEVAGLIMPCHSNPQDREHAYLLADHLGMEHHEVDLSPLYDHFLQQLAPLASDDRERKEMAGANIKPRLRMITLYYFAQSRGYLVAGTGNRSELTVGYFTKYGDAGVDLLPLASLVKTEVRELARYLGIPEVIIDKAPSAGLWEGQTDEGEMGITYEQLDRYILTGEADNEVRARISQMHKASRHKRMQPPAFER